MKKSGINNLLFLVPAWGAGVGLLIIFFVELFHFFQVRFSRGVLFRCIIFLLAFSFIFLCQKFYYQEVGGVIYSSVSNPNYRDVITLGSYKLTGGVDIKSVVKLAFCLFISVLVVLNRKNYSYYDYKRELGLLLVLSFFVQSALYILVQFLNASSFFQFLVGQSQGVAHNHLTVDNFGYRLSMGFYEPSQMSLFIGSVVGAYASLEKDVKKRLLAALLCLFVFATSRSLTIILWSGCVYFLLSCSKKMLTFFVASLVLLIVCFAFVKEYVAGISLFRSIHERSYFPDIDVESPLLSLLIGFDFGQVYSFVPLVGMIMQVGFFGILLLFSLIGCRVRVAILAVLVFTVAPQIWYSFQWLSLSVLYLALYHKKNGCNYCVRLKY